MTEEELEAIRERKERASTIVSSLCKPYGAEGSRRWLMSIPAQPDYDPDLVIGASLRDIPALLAEVERLRADNKRLRDIVDADIKEQEREAKEKYRAIAEELDKKLREKDQR